MLSNIPQELRQYSQWVCWKLVDTGRPKLDKVPFQPHTGRLASPTNPGHWSDFFTAANKAPLYDGIGFVLTDNDPYCFIDFDETYDPEVIAEQQRIFYELNSYSERSPSGAGLHIICKGRIPAGRRGNKIEVYSNARYMTVTGDIFHDVPIQPRQEQINKLFDNLAISYTAALDTSIIDIRSDKSDLDIYNLAQYAENGQKFLSLWAGDFHTYHEGDQSRADYALIDILAFYTQDREQIKRLFRLSGLGQRQKANREDYVNKMISGAFDRMLPEVDISGLALQAEQIMSGAIQVPPEPEPEPKPRPVYPNVNHNPKPKPVDTCPTDIDSGAFSLPSGLLGQVAKFIYDQSYKPIPEIAIVGAVGYLAGMAGRAYNVSNTGLNMYMLLLAGTGRGKEEIARGIGKLTRTIQYTMPTIGDFLGPGDLASGQGLLRYMSDHPTKSFCSVFGEFGIRLKAIANPKSSSSDLMLQKLMLDMFSKSGASDVLLPTAYSDAERNTKAIDSPAFSLIGESSPDWFYNHIDEQMIRTGLLPRFTVIDYSGKRPPSNYTSARVVPSGELITGLCSLATSVYKLLAARQPYEVPFDSESQQLSEQMDKVCDDKINDSESGIVAELWNRAHLKTMRLAALIAVGNNPFQPIITAECWRWAEKFTQHGIMELEQKFAIGFVGETPDENTQIEVLNNAIIRYLVRSYQELEGYDVSAAMHNSKIISAAYISRVIRGHRVFKEDRYGPTAALRRTIQTLIDHGDLQEVSKMQASQHLNFTGRCFAIRSVKLLARAAKERNG